MSGTTNSWDQAKAIALTLAACFVLAAMDALGKHLIQQSLTPTQVVWARYLFHTLLVGILFGATHHHGFLRPAHPVLQFVRGLCLLAVTFGMYQSLTSISLAEATAILFLAPVLVTLLAAHWLKEQILALHWLALALGFGGVLLIIRPGFSSVDPVMLLPLLSAFSLAIYFVITRYLRDKDGEYTTLFHTTATGSVLITLIVPAFWVAPTALQWAQLVLIGILGATGHLLLIRAFHLVNASTLSPYLNAQILAATLYSIWFFDDSISLAFLLGALLIAAAGILAWHTSRRAAV